MKRIGKIIQRTVLLLSLFIIMVMPSGCKVEAAIPILNPPRALRLLTAADSTPSGNLPASPFAFSSANKALFQAFWADSKFIDSIVVDVSTNCYAIEFYAYNVETGFNGYNIYAMGGHSYAGDLAVAWQDYVANLRLYQSAHSGPAPVNTFYPVFPGTIDSPYYASIASNTISFSGGLTKIVVVFKNFKQYGFNAIWGGAGPLYIGVTAVSITEGSIYESLPSNIIEIP